MYFVSSEKTMVVSVILPLLLLFKSISVIEAAAGKYIEVGPANDVIIVFQNSHSNGNGSNDVSRIPPVSKTKDGLLKKLMAEDAESNINNKTVTRRHGDFDAVDDGIGKVPGKGNPNNVNILKSLTTKVMSGVLVDDTACFTKAKGPLMHLFPKSKYFVDTENLYNHHTAKQICRQYGLILADLEDIEDHRSLQTYVAKLLTADGEGYFNKIIFIGANDVETEGIFKMDSGNDLPFQNFHLSQPDDKNQQEDCVALVRETDSGPIGMADVNCNKTGYALCMFPTDSDCYAESKETETNVKHQKKRGLVQVFNISNIRAYYTSNFQLNWNKAMRYCNNRNMTLFNMDSDVISTLFELLGKMEIDFVGVPSPPLLYWTAGRFATTHMDAPIMWLQRPMDRTSSEEKSEEKLPGNMRLKNSTFSWSGIYQWSKQKAKDPGAPHGFRRDLCVTFSFETKTDYTPMIRNSNCDIPAYFVCSRILPHDLSPDYA